GLRRRQVSPRSALSSSCASSELYRLEPAAETVAGAEGAGAVALTKTEGRAEGKVAPKSGLRERPASGPREVQRGAAGSKPTEFTCVFASPRAAPMISQLAP